MAFTSADLTEINTAIINYGKGDRVSMVRFSSGKTIQYADVTLQELMDIKAEIIRDINATAGNSRGRYASTSKGY